MKNMLKRDVAALLSVGKFDEVHSYLSEDVKWNIVNERVLNGFDEVIETEEKVVIVGTAEFYKNDEKVNVIEACDVYFFNDNKVVELKSYCIPLDKDKWNGF